MKRLMSGLLVLSLLGGTVGVAQARDGDRYRDRDRREHQDRDWRDRDRGHDRHWRGDRDRRHWDDRRHHRQRWTWSRGQRFDWHHYRPHYVYVDNWRYYRLRPPPRGYRWVRVDSDFLLIAIATGIILEILNYDRYYDDYYYDDPYYYR